MRCSSSEMPDRGAHALRLFAANQFISIFKLLYVAQLTNRIAILCVPLSPVALAGPRADPLLTFSPTLFPHHFHASPEDLSAFFDLDRFYACSHIPYVEWSSIKAFDTPSRHPLAERLSCWSVQEATTGHANTDYTNLAIHNVLVDHWALPPLARGAGGFDIAFDALRIFLFDRQLRNEWIAKIRLESLPQKRLGERETFKGDIRMNTKSGFKPHITTPPEDQVLCLDNTLFLGPIVFPPGFTEPGPPLEPLVGGEALTWIAAGQYLRFNNIVEDRVDLCLKRLFNVDSLADVPPFISVHLRRGDFKAFTGFAALEKYSLAVERIRQRLQMRLDDQEGWRGPGKEHFTDFGLSANDYAVVTTTDEPSGSPFLDEVRALGWTIVDHEALGTANEYGNWWPASEWVRFRAKDGADARLDSVGWCDPCAWTELRRHALFYILAPWRAASQIVSGRLFRSRESRLANVRWLRSWRGGLVDSAI